MVVVVKGAADVDGELPSLVCCGKALIEAWPKKGGQVQGSRTTELSLRVSDMLVLLRETMVLGERVTRKAVVSEMVGPRLQQSESVAARGTELIGPGRLSREVNTSLDGLRQPCPVSDQLINNCQ